MTAEQKEIETLKARLVAKDKEIDAKKLELAAKTKAIEKSVKTGIVSPPVEGAYTAKYKDDVSAKEITKKIEFKDGRIKVRLKEGHEVSSEAIIRIANNGKPTETELKQFPVLSTITKAVAEDLLIHYAKMGAGFLK